MTSRASKHHRASDPALREIPFAEALWPPRQGIPPAPGAGARTARTAVRPGEGFTIALRRDGSVRVMGEGFTGSAAAIGALSGAKAIAASAATLISVKHDGSVVACDRGGVRKAAVGAWADVVEAAAIGGAIMARTDSGRVHYLGESTLREEIAAWPQLRGFALGSLEVLGIDFQGRLLYAGAPERAPALVGRALRIAAGNGWYYVTDVHGGAHSSESPGAPGRVRFVISGEPYTIFYADTEGVIRCQIAQSDSGLAGAVGFEGAVAGWGSPSTLIFERADGTLWGLGDNQCGQLDPEGPRRFSSVVRLEALEALRDDSD